MTTQRLLLRIERLTPFFYATAAVTALAVAATAVAIWGESDSGHDAAGTWETAAIFWILSVLGFMLLPVLQRFTTAGVTAADVRVLAALGDVELVATRAGSGLEVSLAPGERLVLRKRV